MPAALILVSEHAPVLPPEALPLIRTADEVLATPDLDPATRARLGVGTAGADLADLVATKRVVLVGTRVPVGHGPTERPVAAPVSWDSFSDGTTVVIATPPGVALVAAAGVMDRLRSPGGCPWDAEQTHDTLRRYLIEETYELLEAIEDGDRAAVREELGDVLLQVLFHARVAAEHDEPFTIDDVAIELITKLVGRHPHVFAPGGDDAVPDAATQNERWELLKQREKRRESHVDGVALGQPALALAAKLVQRARRADLPDDLLPTGDDPGARLFAIAAATRHAGGDPEADLRATARAFAARVRAAEAAARAAGITDLTGSDWRAHWPGHR